MIVGHETVDRPKAAAEAAGYPDASSTSRRAVQVDERLVRASSTDGRITSASASADSAAAGRARVFPLD